MTEKASMTMSFAPYRKLLGEVLGASDMSFTVTGARSFRLDEKLRTIEVRRKARENEEGQIEKMVSVEAQIGHYLESARSCEENDPGMGWTMCIAGKTANFGMTELVAATLCGLSIRGGRSAAWIDLQEAMNRRADTVQAYVRQDVVPKTVVITGLRTESHPAKWERAFTILRSTSPSANRIVAAVGAHPLAVMTRLGLPVQRVINLGLVSNEASL